jgi:hypothetical protein
MLLALVLFGLPPQNSPFNTYFVHLEPVTMAGGCMVDDLERFRNRAYRLRKTPGYPSEKSLLLQNGQAVERNVFNSAEWQTDLKLPRVIEVGKIRAVLLEMLAVHVGGTGSRSYLLLVRCRPAAMEVVLEASGPLGESAYSMSDGLTLTHYVWAPDDSHCCPSRQVTERYMWEERRDRFVFADSSEGRIER